MLTILHFGKLVTHLYEFEYHICMFSQDLIMYTLLIHCEIILHK